VGLVSNANLEVEVLQVSSSLGGEVVAHNENAAVLVELLLSVFDNLNVVGFEPWQPLHYLIPPREL